jgi:tRNA pseudouridine55 synthase
MTVKRKSPYHIEAPCGFLNVFKPSGMTSHDVVAKLRSVLRVKQIGHAGTLDRLATGVLPIAVGKACRLIRFLSSEKMYYAEILLGQRTTTDDIEGDVMSCAAIGTPLDRDAILELLKSFEGVQEQFPPAYSAVHHDGERLYKLALRNKTPTSLKARQIKIDCIELLQLQDPIITIRVRCGGGTYIRALARDIGEQLGFGGCIKSLSREQSGMFCLNEANTLAQLEETFCREGMAQLLIDPAKVLSLAKISIEEKECWSISRGQTIAVPDSENVLSGVRLNGQQFALVHDGKVIAICEGREDNKLYPHVVLLDANPNG